MPASPAEAALRCPSAQPGMAEPQILGVMSWEADEPRLAYLNAHLPATPEILGRAGPVAPTEVFRLAARPRRNAARISTGRAASSRCASSSVSRR